MQSISYIYQFDIAAIVVSIAILLSLIRNKTIGTRIVYTYRFLIIFIALAGFFDTCSIFMLRYPDKVPEILHWTVNILYHSIFLAIPLIFYYSIYFSTEDNRMPQFWVRILFTIPYLLTVFMLLLTPFSHLIFYFDQKVYCRGIMFNTLYVSAGFYVCACIYHSIRRRHQFSGYQLFTVLFYMICSVATLVVQYFMQNLMLMNFTLSISAMIVYLSLKNPSDYQDKEMLIYNRSAFTEVVSQKLVGKKKMSILALQIADYKAMEEAIGSVNSQKLLRQIGKELEKVSDRRNNYRVSRSRIAILLDDNPRKCKLQCETIIARMLKPFKCGEVFLRINIKAMHILCPEDAVNVDDVIELIEHSFSKIITESDLTIPRADRSILIKRYREQKILEKIKDAINRDSFEIYYQPIYSEKKHTYEGAEALIRLRDKENNFISPADFIPITEKSGLILKIGTFVFEKVCKYLYESKIYEKGLEYININLSVIQCMQESLASQMIQIMDKYNLRHELIHLEITESAAVVSKDVLLENMLKLKNVGIHFALDDYGTGYSNASNLVAFPFDTVKIDKSMLWAAMKDKKAYTILEESIAMIKDMNLEIIAEGVESKEQSELLKFMGCNLYQGFYYSIPLDENRLALLWTENV